MTFQGLTKAVGVSNFNKDRVAKAAKVLQERGTCLSSNQVGLVLPYTPIFQCNA